MSEPNELRDQAAPNVSAPTPHAAGRPMLLGGRARRRPWGFLVLLLLPGAILLGRTGLLSAGLPGAVAMLVLWTLGCAALISWSRFLGRRRREADWRAVNDTLRRLPGWQVPKAELRADRRWHATAVDARPRGPRAGQETIDATGVTETDALERLVVLLRERADQMGDTPS